MCLDEIRSRISVMADGPFRDPKLDNIPPMDARATAQTAAACFSLGAGTYDLFVRDAGGRPTLDPTILRQHMAMIAQSAPRMVVRLGLEGLGAATVSDYLRVLQATLPAAASVSVAELSNSPTDAKRLVQFAKAVGTCLQFTVQSQADILQFAQWFSGNDRPSVCLTVGRVGSDQDIQPSDLDPFLQKLRSITDIWTLSAACRNELALHEYASSLGASAKVGFGVNCMRPDGKTMRDNCESVMRISQMIGQFDHRQDAAA